MHFAQLAIMWASAPKGKPAPKIHDFLIETKHLFDAKKKEVHTKWEDLIATVQQINNGIVSRTDRQGNR